MQAAWCVIGEVPMVTASMSSSQVTLLGFELTAP